MLHFSKRSLCGAVFGTALITLTAGLFAQEGAVPRKIPSEDPGRQRSAVSHTAFGRIHGVDERRLDVEYGEEIRTVELLQDTYIEIDGERGTLDDLRQNARVRIVRDPDDDSIIRRIIVVSEDHAPTVDNDLDEPLEGRPATVKINPPKKIDLGMEMASGDGRVVVNSVDEDSPAARAGILRGDGIIKVNGENVITPDAVYSKLNPVPGGQSVPLTVKRGDDEKELTLTLPRDHVATIENNAPIRATEPRGENDPQNRKSRSASEASAEELNLGWALREGEKGAWVVRVEPNSPAAEAELMVGDLIVAVDNKSVTAPEAVDYHIEQHLLGETVNLNVVRDGVAFRTGLVLAITPGPVARTAMKPQPAQTAPIARQLELQQQQIADLYAQIQALRAEVQALRGDTPSPAADVLPPSDPQPGVDTPNDAIPPDSDPDRPQNPPPVIPPAPRPEPQPQQQ